MVLLKAEPTEKILAREGVTINLNFLLDRRALDKPNGYGHTQVLGHRGQRIINDRLAVSLAVAARARFKIAVDNLRDKVTAWNDFSPRENHCSFPTAHVAKESGRSPSVGLVSGEGRDIHLTAGNFSDGVSVGALGDTQRKCEIL